MDRKTLYIASAICISVIIISGYLALSSTSREPTGFGGMMGPWMMQNFGSQSSIIYLGLLIVAVIALGVVLILYRMEQIAVKGREGTASPREAPDIETGVESSLEILPEDEQAVMAPILKDPGLTQSEVVAFSKYSKAKVSQVLSGLENRGLIYREKQGKTFRVYPGKKMEK